MHKMILLLDESENRSSSCVRTYGSRKVRMRTKDSMKSFDRWGFAAEANYQIFSFLKAEAGYEIHHRDRGNEGWKSDIDIV